MWHFLAIVSVFCRAMLGRNFSAFLFILAFFHWDCYALFFWCTIGRWCSIGWLWLLTLLVVFCCALLLIATLILINCPALLVRDLFTVVKVKCPTLFPWHNFAVVAGCFCIGCFLLAVTFLTLLPFHISVFLNVDLPALFVRDFFARLLGLFVTFQFFGCPALLFRYFHTAFHVITMFMRYILAALTVCSLAELFRNAFTLLIIGGMALLLRYALTLLIICCMTLLFRYIFTLLIIRCVTLLLGSVCTFLLISCVALLLVFTFLLWDIFTCLPVVIRRLTLLLVSSLAHLLVFTILLWFFCTFFVIHCIAAFLRHLFAFLVINCLAVLLGYFLALLVVNCFAVLLGYLVTLLVINCLAVLLWYLLALLAVGGGALFVVLALILVLSLALLLWNCCALVFIHRVAHISISDLTLCLHPGFAGTDIVKLASTTTRKRL